MEISANELPLLNMAKMIFELGYGHFLNTFNQLFESEKDNLKGLTPQDLNLDDADDFKDTKNKNITLDAVKCL